MAPVRIHLKRNNILQTKADVCVSTVHRTGDLTKGPLAKQFLKACGQSVQDEIFQACKDGDLKHGEVVLTDAGKLKQVQNLMFVCLYSWRPGNEQFLVNSVLECLELATVQGYRSIAFPALGMGGQYYPAHKVAAALIDAVALHNERYCLWKKSESFHSLEDVYIVLLDEETEAIKAFLRICEENSISMEMTSAGSNQQGKSAKEKMKDFFESVLPKLVSTGIGGKKGPVHFKIRPNLSKKAVGFSLDFSVETKFFTGLIMK